LEVAHGTCEHHMYVTVFVEILEGLLA